MALRDDRGSMDREILDIIPERFDSDPDSHYARKGAHTRLILTVALALLAVAALGVAARQIFFDKPAHEQTAGVPVLRADERPIKTKPGPDDRGGMEVPNRDKLVYEHMGTNESEPQRESLLPPPEQAQVPPAAQPRKPSIKPAFPAPPPRTTAAEPPPATAAPQVPVTAGKPAVSAPVPAPASQQVAAVPQPAAAAKAAAVPPAPVKAVPAAISAPAEAAHKAVAGGGWVVQLGAVHSEKEAQAEWSRVHGANKDTLSGLSSDIVRVDLGAKGIFWRVRGGPVDEAQARTICAQLTKRNQGCIIARK
jgi:hypothetical protein